ncbi:MAG: acylphosphatase [Nitrospina sp.]|jgi:acylphosphatase|nr:acylphosphatase [Nitrospina sp.]MBT6601837.1 acylphosphatase [Nitrospina sp.]
MLEVATNITVHGKVHGVCFRVSAKAKALELCLTGWVRNLANGTVEVHAEGNQDSIDQLIKWCQKGPPLAKVSRCDLDWIAPQGIDNFRIL